MINKFCENHVKIWYSLNHGFVPHHVPLFLFKLWLNIGVNYTQDFMELNLRIIKKTNQIQSYSGKPGHYCSKKYFHVPSFLHRILLLGLSKIMIMYILFYNDMMYKWSTSCTGWSNVHSVSIQYHVVKLFIKHSLKDT